MQHLVARQINRIRASYSSASISHNMDTSSVAASLKDVRVCHIVLFSSDFTTSLLPPRHTHRTLSHSPFHSLPHRSLHEYKQLHREHPPTPKLPPSPLDQSALSPSPKPNQSLPYKQPTTQVNEISVKITSKNS